MSENAMMGNTVYYVKPEGRITPAIILEALPDNKVNLEVFGAGGIQKIQKAVEYFHPENDDHPKDGTWHWPED